MILLWISLGYIMPSYERQSLEDAAQECLTKLIMQGFFNMYDRKFFSMHDVMYDLVISIAGDKYKRADAGECEIDNRVRHLSLIGNESITEPFTDAASTILKLKQLQSLLIDGGSYEWSSLCTTKKIFHMLPRLRILSLPGSMITKVPSSLGELITLRYLDLSGTLITRLPNSITQLVELLSLDVSYCWKLDELPKVIKKLVKLRHFRNTKCPALIPKGVERLIDLQTLVCFPLKFTDGFPRESDCGLAELKIILNRLVGEINVCVIGDAICRSSKGKEQKMEGKGNLRRLDLKLKDGSTKGDEMVIEALQPMTNLRELSINGYKGERSPRWFKNLVCIALSDFECLRSLGSIGKLLHLKELYCHNLEKLEYIEEYRCGNNRPNSPLFPSLEILSFGKMPKLKGWYKVFDEESSTSSSVQHKRNILLASELGFLKLRQLYVTNMEFLISMTREFRGFSSLTSLQIYNCEDLKAIPDGDGIASLSNLETVWLHNCNEELKERCQEPHGEDWPLIKHIPNLNFYNHFP